jgi:hypothetical protein
LAVGLLAACSSQKEEEKTARLFLDLYLVASDQKAAIQLCSGRARAQLQEEMDLLSGLSDREQSVAELKPDMRVEKVYEKARPGGDVAFLFKVQLARPEVKVPARDAFLLVGREDGQMRVKSFNFGPTDSHTSDTP